MVIIINNYKNNNHDKTLSRCAYNIICTNLSLCTTGSKKTSPSIHKFIESLFVQDLYNNKNIACMHCLICVAAFKTSRFWVKFD